MNSTQKQRLGFILIALGVIPLTLVIVAYFSSGEPKPMASVSETLPPLPENLPEQLPEEQEEVEKEEEVEVEEENVPENAPKEEPVQQPPVQQQQVQEPQKPGWWSRPWTREYYGYPPK